MDKLTIASFVKDFVDLYKDKTALVHKKQGTKISLSYKDLYEKACSIAGYFKHLKLKKGDKVVLYLDNSPQLAAKTEGL